MMISDKWVLLVRVTGEAESQILRGLLEAHDISVNLVREGVGRVYGLEIGPLAEVQILVPSSQFRRGQEVLDALARGDFEDVSYADDDLLGE